ncbi:MAG: ATP-binding cassette domain-containing protein, partial [bacterium]
MLNIPCHGVQGLTSSQRQARMRRPQKGPRPPGPRPGATGGRPLLELIGVGISDRLVGRLDRLSFEVREGEVLGLVGGSGAGKTAALAVAAGQVTPQRGRVTLEGRDVSRRPGRLRAIAGLAPEALPGPHDLSAADWLAFWAALDGVPGREVAKRRAGVLELFGLAAPDDLVAGLSRGARRRLGLARLWLRLPRLLLLDAPGD